MAANRAPRAEVADQWTKPVNVLCGGSDLRNVVLVTTMCDEVKAEVVADRVVDLREHFWSSMILHGSGIDSSYRRDTTRSAWGTLNQFEELHPPQRQQL